MRQQNILHTGCGSSSFYVLLTTHNSVCIVQGYMLIFLHTTYCVINEQVYEKKGFISKPCYQVVYLIYVSYFFLSMYIHIYVGIYIYKFFIHM